MNELKIFRYNDNEVRTIMQGDTVWWVLKDVCAVLGIERGYRVAERLEDYFDELVNRNLLTNFRETAKQLEVKEKDFITFLLNKKFIYRDKKGKLLPYADKNNGLFEVKECYNEKTQWSGTQTLITPKGRETFRLLFLKAVC